MSFDHFSFDEASHVYKLGGVTIPSVTQVLREVGLVPDFPPGPYRVRGRAVHKVTQLYDLKYDIDEERCGEGIVGYLRAWKAVSAEYAWVWDEDGIERQMFDPILLVAGTADRIGTWREKRLVLDIKSGAAGAEVALQTAGYARMRWPEDYAEVLRASVEIHADGTYSPPVFYDDWQDFIAWEGAVRLYQWKRRKAR